MENVRDIDINAFNYNLPEESIPLHPLEKRDECKLLLRSPGGTLYHRKFKELPGLIPPSSLLVCNDTKVINARLGFHKDSGAAIELFLLEPLVPSDYALNFQSRASCQWKCLVGNSKKWKEDKIYCEVTIGEDRKLRLEAERLDIYEDGSSKIEFTWKNPDFTFGQIIEFSGKIPIPPYLNRESEDSDLQDYQTVYARVKGSVAAPTAGLHFTPEVFEALKAHNIDTAKLTLHVGAGTFRPVKSDKIGEHPMHSEPFSVTRGVIEQLIDSKKRGRKVIAVGTTSVRSLESLPYIGQALLSGRENPYVITQWVGYHDEEFETIEALQAILDKMQEEKRETLTASTSIMIAPGFTWRVTDGMVTNFHQPKSTLLLLVSSFLGGEEWKKVYDTALASDYRFLSYGDACLFIGGKNF